MPGGTLDPAQSRPAATGVETQVVSPTAEGLIVVRAPVIGIAWSGETEAALRQASCTQIKRAS